MQGRAAGVKAIVFIDKDNVRIFQNTAAGFAQTTVQANLAWTHWQELNELIDSGAWRVMRPCTLWMTAPKKGSLITWRLAGKWRNRVRELMAHTVIPYTVPHAVLPGHYVSRIWMGKGHNQSAFRTDGAFERMLMLASRSHLALCCTNNRSSNRCAVPVSR